MAKLSLTDIAAGYALIATYNANNALIEAALENTVSRDGTTPNTMSADLDMNSQQITNLPTPIETSHATSKAYVDGLISAVQSAGDFSEALVYDFSNTITFSGGNIIRFRDGSSVRILGPADTGQVSNTHDDTDFITSFTATTDWDIVTLTGNMWLRDGAGFKLSNATDDETVTIVHNGTDVTVTADGGTPNFHLVDAWLALKVDGALKLQERAAAVADDATYGQIWIKDDSPNNLYYTDDTGQDVAITDNGKVAGVDQTAVNTADESKASTTTMAAAANIAAIVLDPASWYEITVKGNYTQNVGNFKMALGVSQTLNSQQSLGKWYSQDASNVELESVISNATVGISVTTMTDTDNVYFEYKYIVETHATLDSDLTLYWAQETSSANNTTLEAGTVVRAKKIS